MRSVLLGSFLVSVVSLAAGPAKKTPPAPKEAPKAAAVADPGDGKRQLTGAEQISMCAANLVKKLECKDEFCAVMANARVEGDPKFKGGKVDELKAMCLKEIAVDGSGDDKAREAKCAGWQKERGEMVATKSDADAMTACWTKADCKERVACWAPRMKAMMEATMAKKDPAPAAK